MIGVLGAIVMIGVLITVHEFGHFVVAKLSGVKVEVFSIGFGSPIVRRKWGETEYRIAWVPVGGYVRLLGHDPTDTPDPQDAGRSLYDKPPLVRILISAAGPLMNILLPLAIIPPLVWLSSSYDRVPDNQIGGLDEGMPAYTAGLREGDAIVEIDGEPIGAFWQIKREIDAYDPDDGPLAITVERPGEGRRAFQVTPTARTRTDPLLGFTSTEYFIGYMPAFLSNLVAITDPAGPLARAGVRTFDRILRVDGEETPRYVDVERALAALAPSQTVPLAIARDAPLEGDGAPSARASRSSSASWRSPSPTPRPPPAPRPGCAPPTPASRPSTPTTPPRRCSASATACSPSTAAPRASAPSSAASSTTPRGRKAVTVLRDGQQLEVSLAREQVTLSDPFSGDQTVWLPGFTFPAGQVAIVPAPDTPNADRLAHGWYEARTNLARGFRTDPARHRRPLHRLRPRQPARRPALDLLCRRRERPPRHRGLHRDDGHAQPRHRPLQPAPRAPARRRPHPRRRRRDDHPPPALRGDPHPADVRRARAHPQAVHLRDLQRHHPHDPRLDDRLTHQETR
ncbi:MAG: site-2 protease family protein [Myxococcales bacterium]|nr:site-2 protease family protein [Myxococcales bacterium]